MFFPKSASRPSYFLSVAAMLLASTVLNPAIAAGNGMQPPKLAGPPKKIGLRDSDSFFTESHVFVNAHPDLRHRRLAQDELKNENYTRAIYELERAASYADKLSQSILAELHWEGTGTKVDRPLAYAWADLAAERNTPAFLAKREYYWEQLSPAEREQAIILGGPLYAEYGDEVAKIRQEKGMRRANQSSVNRRHSTYGKVCVSGGFNSLKTERMPQWSAGGENTAANATLAPGGFDNMQSKIDCPVSVSADKFYNPKYWEPEKYWAWQEQVIEASINPHIFPYGSVEIGPLQQDGK